MIERKRPPSMRRAQARGPLAVAGIALGFGLGGCSAEVSIGDKDQASGSSIAKDITGEYERRTKIELPRLTCQEAEAKVGAPIACTGRNAREIELELSGEVTAVDDGGLDYRWEISKALAPGTFYASSARDVLERQGAPVADLSCPAKVEVRVNNQVRCLLRTTDGDERDVLLLLTDTDGAFKLKVAGAAKGKTSGQTT